MPQGIEPLITRHRTAGLCIGLAIALVVLRSSAHAQDGFTVASVKPNASGLPYGQSTDRVDGVTLINERLRDLILLAYGIQEFQLTGGPDWVSRERFDVVATAGQPLSLEQKQANLRKLLANRFGFRAHAETREERVYRLTRMPGARSPGLKSRDCAAPGAVTLLVAAESPPRTAAYFGWVASRWHASQRSSAACSIPRCWTTPAWRGRTTSICSGVRTSA